MIVITPEHKDFIEKKMKELAAYDAQRPEGHVYEFHLHSERVAQSMKALARHLGHDKEMADILYWATLPHDIGKMDMPVTVWDTDAKPTDEQRKERRTHTWRGVNMVKEAFGDAVKTDPFLKLMIQIMNDHHEALDGSGFQGKKEYDLTHEVKMACICDAFDGWSTRRPGFAADRDLSPKGVINRMEVEKAGQFDPVILHSFKEMKL